MLRLVRLLLLALIALHAPGAAAEGIELRRGSVDVGDEGYVINADFNIELRPRQEDAVGKGLSLYFLVEFEATRSRWYWLDEKVVSQQQRLRLTYQPLTRQYRLSSGALHQNFSTLEEAVRTLSRVRSWLIPTSAQFRTGDSFTGALRMRLDLTQLPKPFQVDALTSRDWNLSSDWRRWTFTLAAPVQEAVGKPTPQEGDVR
jgi:hypothetical protein